MRNGVWLGMLAGCAPAPESFDDADASVDTDVVEIGPLVGPANGTLLIIGGGSGGYDRFLELCGGPDQPTVHIPTSNDDGHYSITDPEADRQDRVSRFGHTELTIVHTRDPTQADAPLFFAPIEAANCVWLTGGRQWRSADAYLSTATLTALFDLLHRGGVIAGSSAGASIQASFLVRGDTESNEVVIGDHTDGFGFLQGVGIDQHVAERGREYDLIEVVEADPSLLGVGLDESTWIEVTQDDFEVGGPGEVYVHDVASWPAEPASDEDRVLRLRAGDVYDLAARRLDDPR